MYKNVEFLSEGAKIQGHLYLSGGSEGKRLPAVLLCHGFAAVKEMLIPPFAEYFARAGFAALTFDYRGFGESEGAAPRIVPGEQCADIRNALTYLRSLPEVDPSRVGLWGTSYGGANALTVAAFDARVKCACVQIAFGDGERMVTGGMDEAGKAKFMESLDKIWARAVTTGKEMVMPLPKLLSDPQSKEFYEKNHERFPALDVKLSFLTVKETLTHRPEYLVPHLRVPVHYTLAENDLVNPPFETRSLYEKTASPKDLLEMKGADHYAIYEPPFFDGVVQAQTAWFRRHLQ
jgi:pimeloyl-ACP methyl ester carboxylesterase